MFMNGGFVTNRTTSSSFGNDLVIILRTAPALLFVCLSGCGNPSPPVLPAQPAAQPSSFQRFLPVPSVPERKGASAQWAGQFALDTVTGQLCYTFADPNAKPTTVPLCRDLLTK
jgi:hypothetical protein